MHIPNLTRGQRVLLESIIAGQRQFECKPAITRMLHDLARGQHLITVEKVWVLREYRYWVQPIVPVEELQTIVQGQ